MYIDLKSTKYEPKIHENSTVNSPTDTGVREWLLLKTAGKIMHRVTYNKRSSISSDREKNTFIGVVVRT